MITYYDTNNRYHEYTGQIDFRLSMRTPKWQVVTFVPTHRTTELCEHFCNNMLFTMFDFDYREIGSKTAFMLVPTVQTVNDLTKARRLLLRYLHNHNLKIIWKEDNHGYDINSSGTIYRKWKLTEATPTKVVNPNGKIIDLKIASRPAMDHGAIDERVTIQDYTL